MFINANGTNAYADLGDAWLSYQTARLHQKHLQFGRHFYLDVDALLNRAARIARAARPIEALTARENVSTDHIRRAMLEVTGLCGRLERPVLLFTSWKQSPSERRMQSRPHRIVAARRGPQLSAISCSPMSSAPVRFMNGWPFSLTSPRLSLLMSRRTHSRREPSSFWCRLARTMATGGFWSRRSTMSASS